MRRIVTNGGYRVHVGGEANTDADLWDQRCNLKCITMQIRRRGDQEVLEGFEAADCSIVRLLEFG